MVPVGSANWACTVLRLKFLRHRSAMSHHLLSWSAKQAFFETERRGAALTRPTPPTNTPFSALRIPAKAGLRGEGATLGRGVSGRNIPAERDSQNISSALQGAGCL